MDIKSLLANRAKKKFNNKPELRLKIYDKIRLI